MNRVLGGPFLQTGLLDVFLQQLSSFICFGLFLERGFRFSFGAISHNGGGKQCQAVFSIWPTLPPTLLENLLVDIWRCYFSNNFSLLVQKKECLVLLLLRHGPSGVGFD